MAHPNEVETNHPQPAPDAMAAGAAMQSAQLPVEGDPRGETAGLPEEIPRDRKRGTLMIVGLLAVLASALYIAWGFVAPAEDPDVAPMEGHEELPVQE